MAKVLVVGGAGYVGSTACAFLLDAGHEVWVLDNLSTGHSELVLTKNFVQADAGDRKALAKLLARERMDCVMHFAAKSLVGESFQKKDEYFENNVTQTRELLQCLLEFGVHRFIFSSTCAIFGDPGGQDLHENLPEKPINPYGETKLQVEKDLRQLAQDTPLNAIAFRYFNAAGAEPKLRVGEWHEPESHLIPKVIQALIQSRPIEVYGSDYPTPDGSCIRDYIHVWDLAWAHCAGMERLLKSDAKKKTGSFEAFNLGSENGYSVQEIIQGCESVTQKKAEVLLKERRSGDPARLVAQSAWAKKELGFGKNLQSLTSILSSAYQWELKRLKLKSLSSAI
ncbi:MAG: UDP-glucose 4-epimerase GalE [Bdellovibrionia bacterium]